MGLKKLVQQFQKGTVPLQEKCMICSGIFKNIKSLQTFWILSTVRPHLCTASLTGCRKLERAEETMPSNRARERVVEKSTPSHRDST